MVDIYEFDDYRNYLKEMFAARQKIDKGFTHRHFAKEAGFSNPGFLNDVVCGRRKLSAEAQQKMILGFNLKPADGEYFKLLVEFGQAKKEVDKEALYKQLLFRRSRSNFARLNPAHIRYYQDYRYPLVRSAIEVVDFRGDFERLAKYLVPELPAAVVKKCVQDLVSWGLVRQSGVRYEVTSRFVEPPKTLREPVRQLNREWIMQAAEALSLFDRSERHISSMLLNVSAHTALEIRSMVEDFREKIFEVIKNDSHPEQTLQLNIQFFPRSKKKGGAGHV